MSDIRQVVWSKLVNNMTISILCLVTGQTARAAVEDPALEHVVRRLLDEARAVAAAHDAGLDTIAPVGGRAPDHKPSILQDYERRRPLEIDALINGPAAFARQAGIDTPTQDLIAALAVDQPAAAGLLRRSPGHG